MIKKAVIDYSAFQDFSGGEVLKEVTVVDVDTKCEQHWIFKCPEDSPDGWTGPIVVRKYNNWLSRHFHGLDSYNGYSEYESLLSSLESVCSDIPLLFAADSEKAKGLEKIFKSNRVVFDLESLGCPPMPWSTTPTLQSEKDDKGGDDCVDGDQDSSQAKTLVSDRKQCLYHSLHAPGFYCTRSRAHYLADWCIDYSDLVDMNDPHVRERTFAGWKLKEPSASLLADSGFVRLLSSKDATKCVYCGLILHKWEEGDDPCEDHFNNAPYCLFHRYTTQSWCEDEERNVMEEQQKKKKKADHKGGYTKFRCGAADVNARPSDELPIWRQVFQSRYGNAKDLTWDEVSCLCKA